MKPGAEPALHKWLCVDKKGGVFLVLASIVLRVLQKSRPDTGPLGDSCEAYFPPFQIHRPGNPQESVLICGRMSQRLSRSSFQ